MPPNIANVAATNVTHCVAHFNCGEKPATATTLTGRGCSRAEGFAQP